MKSLVRGSSCLLLLAGCLDLTVEERPAGLDLGECGQCATTNDLQGEVILFVNGKLSDGAAAWTANQKDEEGRFVGGGLFLYDPDRQGHLVKLGNVLFGEDPDNYHGWLTTTFRDVAWSAEHGLWGVTIDQPNDEWRLTRIDVPDWRGNDQLLPQQSFALRSTDAAYWEEDLTGLTFVGDRLLIGGRGAPGQNTAGGALYRAELPTAWGIDPTYPNDLDYYADRDLTELWGRFPSQTGVAGDLCVGPDGDLLAMVRNEHRNAGPLDVNLLYRSPLEEAAPAPTDAVLSVARNEDLQGLAVVNGRLFALETRGKVFEIDLATGESRLHDDLLPLFDDPNALRVRGATTIEIPSE